MFIPFQKTLNFDSGALSPDANKWERKFSEMSDFFVEGRSIRAESEDYDPIIYEVYDCPVPDDEGH